MQSRYILEHWRTTSTIFLLTATGARNIINFVFPKSGQRVPATGVENFAAQPIQSDRTAMPEPFALALYRRHLNGETAQNIAAELGISLDRIEMRLRAAAKHLTR